jgi:hypothetical protein
MLHLFHCYIIEEVFSYLPILHYCQITFGDIEIEMFLVVFLNEGIFQDPYN